MTEQLQEVLYDEIHFLRQRLGEALEKNERLFAKVREYAAQDTIKCKLGSSNPPAEFY